MTRLGPLVSAAVLLVLWAAPGGAAPEVAQTPAGLAPVEAQKLDPVLWRALGAEAAAARGVAPGVASAPWLALAAGVTPSDAGPLLDLLIRFDSPNAEAARGVLSGLDLAPGAVLGPVATLSRVPLDKVVELARNPAVARIEPATRYHTFNDVSVPETGAPSVWAHPQYPATGLGVIVAIIDTGIDPDHPDFQHPNGTTRIVNLLDLAQPSNGPLGGTLFSSAQIDAGIETDDLVGHGTHVAGTAAGGGQADPAFSGMAPESDLLIVNASRGGDGSFSSVDIVNSLAWVDSRAVALERPYVANLSLGGHAGAHDGTALEEVAIDNLVGDGKVGKSVVIAAGNDRSGAPRHAQGFVNEGGVTVDLGVPDYSAAPGNFNDFLAVSIWYEASSDFQITLTSPSNHSFGPFGPNEWNGSSGESTNQGLVGVANALGGVDPENGDREVQIVVIDGPTPPAEGIWKITIAGDTGPFDAYVAQSSIGAQFTSHVAQGGFVAEPGSARNAITVGAYMTKLVWTDADQNVHDLRLLGYPNYEAGQLADFSNIGPTRDGRLKPEIAAPGQEIASVYTTDANPSVPQSAYRTPLPQFPNFFLLPGLNYAIQQGTSQASPHVAGAVALLLERHPDWDQLDLRRALTETAREDAYTGPVPNVGFGFGKLDVLAAVEGAKASGVPPAGDVDGDLTVDLDDANMALGFVLGTTSPTFEQGLRTDMNRDLQLNVGDIVLIVRTVIAAGAHPSPAVLAGDPDATSGDPSAWLLPIAIHPDVKGAQVSGVDLALAPTDPAVELGHVKAAGDGILALDGDARKVGARRLIALAIDGSDLASRSAVFMVPFDGPTAAGHSAPGRAGFEVTALQLIGPNGKPVPGTVELGQPVRAGAPKALRIAALVPEPGHGARTIVIDVPGGAANAAHASPVEVAIYDASGRHIRSIAREPLAPGEHRLAWDGRGERGPVAAGIYWVRATLGDQIASARLTVIK